MVNLILQGIVHLGKRKHTEDISIEDATRCAQVLHKLIKGKTDLASGVRTEGIIWKPGS
jgi:hypothetical protein